MPPTQPETALPETAQSPAVLASGTLATRRRTVAGVLGQCGLAGFDESEVQAVLRLSGLPARAAQDPDFPISVDRELTALSFMLQRVLASQRTCAEFAIEIFSAVGINHYGILGLAMQHAPSVLDALQVMLAYPELCWGHSRIVLSVDGDRARFSFEMDAPMPRDVATSEMREYCVTRDLVSVGHLIGDITGDQPGPLAVAVPFADPGAHFHAGDWLGCPVHFDAPLAAIWYPRSVADAVPVHAGDLSYRRYRKVASAMSSVLAEDEDMAEQCLRLLWAYTPAPSRAQLSDMLGLSTRSLARHLKEAGTSYAELLKKVQSERASNYLRHSRAPVAEIAERMGYSDAAAFTRAFQAWTGTTPARWRRSRRPAE